MLRLRAAGTSGRDIARAVGVARSTVAEYLRQADAARVSWPLPDDLDDLEHNTRDGLHVASLAGTWIALVAGLAGMREIGGTLSFLPRLPEGITRLSIGTRLSRASRT